MHARSTSPSTSVHSAARPGGRRLSHGSTHVPYPSIPEVALGQGNDYESLAAAGASSIAAGGEGDTSSWHRAADESAISLMSSDSVDVGPQGQGRKASDSGLGVLHAGGVGARRMSIATAAPAASFAPHSFSATQSSIRSSTARLADFASRQEHSSGPPPPGSLATGLSRSSSANAAPGYSSPPVDHAKQSFSPGRLGPSGLSMMLSAGSGQPSPTDETPPPSSAPKDILKRLKSNVVEDSDAQEEISPSTSVTPRASQFELPADGMLGSFKTPRASFYSEGLERSQSSTDDDDDEEAADYSQGTTAKPSRTASVGQSPADERTPLLTVTAPTQDPLPGLPSKSSTPAPSTRKHFFSSLTNRLPTVKLQAPTGKQVYENVVKAPVAALPAVILGLLLNVLDGVSYGMIMFPSNDTFPDFGTPGVAMFFMSCIVSQLTFTLGGSIFKGGNGSMMIEAVPFFHILVNIITETVGEDKPEVIIPTVMASFAFSAILTGIVFMLLGRFRLGALIGFFPRHILVGCIGGVGVFLIETGLEVAAGLEDVVFNHETYVQMFGSWHNALLWTIPLFLAILLRLITLRYTHELIFPAYFFVVPVVFYIVVLSARIPMDALRASRWVFDVGTKKEPWYRFYTCYDFRMMDWGAFWKALPTQFALVFFGILHVPLNVPALGVSLSEDNVKLDRELIAHGYSNLLAGAVGTVPNYLCYVNTVLFYRVGGGTRLAGCMLAAATAGVMFAGPSVIGFLPVMVVAALIFVLGIDLVKEALWDTRHKVTAFEYITIVAITVGMTVMDFVAGLLLGIVIACFFFVVQSSRRRAIRAEFDGAIAKSTVRRPATQRAFIKEVGRQTQVLKLQGFLFFGTFSAVEDEIRRLLDVAVWEHNPIRFLILDLWMVYGLDFSSAEAFVRIQRLLAAKGVVLIFCGAHPEGAVGKALQAVELWSDEAEGNVQVFDTLNDALEWTENAYLTAFYAAPQRKQEASPVDLTIPQIRPNFALGESYENSPRRRHLAKAGDQTIVSDTNHAYSPAPKHDNLPAAKVESDRPALAPPLPLLMKTFSPFADLSEDFWFKISPYFKPVHFEQGAVLWKQGDEAEGMYVIELGILKAVYKFTSQTRLVSESMVAGTVAGELTFISRTPRNATVTAELATTVWMLDQASLEKLEQEQPREAIKFVKVLMKVSKEEHDILTSNLVTVLS